MSSIKFGTSGWRGLIARDFTFENVRLATQGIALYLKAELANPKSAVYGRKPIVILGYDTRFLGREFSLAVAEVLASNGLTPLRCKRHTHTPAIAHTIRILNALGHIILTPMRKECTTSASLSEAARPSWVSAWMVMPTASGSWTKMAPGLPPTKSSRWRCIT